MKRPIAVLAILLSAGGVLVYLTRPIAADILPSEAITVDGSLRSYRLVIPHTLPKPAPVVFAFHGIGDATGGRPGEVMARYSGLDRLAAKHGFVLVYPAAEKSMWAATNIDVKQLDMNRDVRFFDQLLDNLSQRLEIDERRIYVVGFSKGATFAQVLAHVRSEKIAAVAAHSGSRPDELGRIPHRPFPVLLIVGENDLPDVVRSDAEEYRAAGHPAEFMAVPGLGHEWSRRHNGAIGDFLSQHALSHPPGQ